MQVSDKDGMVMIYVPEGDFSMGIPEDQYADAIKSCGKAGISTADCENWFRGGKPQHMVWMDAYWIDKTEVINEMYAKCIAAGICYPPPKKKIIRISEITFMILSIKIFQSIL